jgi:hypothetical protein
MVEGLGLDGLFTALWRWRVFGLFASSLLGFRATCLHKGRSRGLRHLHVTSAFPSKGFNVCMSICFSTHFVTLLSVVRHVVASRDRRGCCLGLKAEPHALHHPTADSPHTCIHLEVADGFSMIAYAFTGNAISTCRVCQRITERTRPGGPFRGARTVVKEDLTDM